MLIVNNFFIHTVKDFKRKLLLIVIKKYCYYISQHINITCSSVDF